MASKDLRTFEVVSHIAERMDSVAPAFDLTKATSTSRKAYGSGYWASSIAQRPSDKTFCESASLDFSFFYLVDTSMPVFAGCERTTFTSQIYTAKTMLGPWTQIASFPQYLPDIALLFLEQDGVEKAYVSGSDFSTLSYQLTRQL